MPTKRPPTLEKLFQDRGLNPTVTPSGEINSHCPFTELHSADSRKRKQFSLSPEKGVYFCFSCKSRGTLTKLLTTRFGVPLFETLDYLSLDPIAPSREVIEDMLADHIVDFSTPPKMFLERGFTPELLRFFEVGSYRDRFDVEVATIPIYLDRALKGVGYRRESIVRGKKVRQFWHSRGFAKEECLYNFNNCMGSPFVILEEGFTDVWRTHQHGLNACGLLGTHLSPTQVDMLTEFPLVYSAMDMDAPGFYAAEMVYHYLKSTGVDLLFVPYPASDPGGIKSPVQWKQALAKALPYLEYSATLYEKLPAYADIVRRAKWDFQNRKK